MRSRGRSGKAGAAGRPDAYERLVRSARYREERAEKAEVILALCGEDLAAASRPADLGSGTGLIKKTLEMKLGIYIYGFELDRTFMVWRRGTAVADVCRLPAPDEAFDFLLLNHLYEHVEDQPGLFREAYRVVRPGGAAYVSAGNALAVMEPHYRLPFLSWLPRPAADAYLRVSGRGRAYEGIRFRTRGRLVAMMEGAGFRARDLTEVALERLPGVRRRGAWTALRWGLGRLPEGLRRRLLRGLSPQWFFMLEKPSGREPDAAAPNGHGSEVA